MKDLTTTPNELIEITNDHDAKALLLQLGVLDKFSQRGPLADKWSEALHFTTHPTHWVLARLYTGFKNPADNGYVVQCFPKSRFSIEQMKQIAAKATLDMFPTGQIEEFRPGRTRPENN